MTVNTPHDLMVFVYSLLCGQIISLIFDIFRAMRRVYPPGKNMIAAQDIIFCAIAFLIFSQTVTVYNQGRVRWFEVVGAILGATLYLTAESPFLLPKICVFFSALSWLVTKLKRAFAIVFALITRPFSRLFGIIWHFIKCTIYQFRQKCIKKLSKSK